MQTKPKQILFNLFGEYIMHQVLDGWKGGINIGGQNSANVTCAYGATFVAFCKKEMYHLLARIEKETVSTVQQH